jgi:hypothetical protein
MASNGKPQLLKNIFSQQANGAVTERLQRFGGQDKTAVRVASRQPEPLRTSARSQPLNNNPERTKKHGSTKRKTVHLVLWVNPIVKAALTRSAEYPHPSCFTAKRIEQPTAAETETLDADGSAR